MTSKDVLEKKPLKESQPYVQEFSVRIPKKTKKRYNLMHFNAAQRVDFKAWRKVRMHRENNERNGTRPEDEQPIFGAGSEFGRVAREEARRRRLGIRGKGYRAEDQPWILRANFGVEQDKTEGKKFRGIKEGGVGENSAYYVFTHSADGTIEAQPLHEWYKFHPVQRYKALSAEEAEEEFNRRGKVMNYFSVMLRKRLRNEDDDDEDPTASADLSKGRSKKKSKDLKISEMDEWMDSDEESSGSNDSDQENKSQQSFDSKDKKDKKKADEKKKAKWKKKKKKTSDDEAFEESDDGDEEGRECEYISDSSASDSELEQQKEIKSVAEESGLRKLLASDEEDDTEDEEEKKNRQEEDDDAASEDEEKTIKDKDDSVKTSQSSDKKSAGDKRKATHTGRDSGGSNNSFSDLESSADVDKDQTESTRSDDASPTKRSKFDATSAAAAIAYIPGASESGITVDAVSRYLLRKPLTMIDLLKKFKSKKTGLTKEEIGHILMLVLTKINPIKQKINGIMYYSLPK